MGSTVDISRSLSLSRLIGDTPKAGRSQWAGRTIHCDVTLPVDRRDLFCLRRVQFPRRTRVSAH